MDKKLVLLHRNVHGLFKMFVFFFKISFLATLCNKDLITLITAAHAQCVTGAKSDACSVFEPKPETSIFSWKKKKKPPVLKHICLLFVFLMNHVFMQIHIFLLLFSGRLDPCHHLRGGDTYSRFHVSGCCVEWNGAHAYRARVRCELADQTRICLWDRGKSAHPPPPTKPPPNLSILINDPLIVAKCQLSLAPETTQAHRCRRAHTQTQMLCGHPHQTTNSHLGIR